MHKYTVARENDVFKMPMGWAVMAKFEIKCNLKSHQSSESSPVMTTADMCGLIIRSMATGGVSLIRASCVQMMLTVSGMWMPHC